MRSNFISGTLYFTYLESICPFNFRRTCVLPTRRGEKKPTSSSRNLLSSVTISPVIMCDDEDLFYPLHNEHSVYSQKFNVQHSPVHTLSFPPVLRTRARSRALPFAGLTPYLEVVGRIRRLHNRRATDAASGGFSSVPVFSATPSTPFFFLSKMSTPSRHDDHPVVSRRCLKGRRCQVNWPTPPSRAWRYLWPFDPSPPAILRYLSQAQTSFASNIGKRPHPPVSQ